MALGTKGQNFWVPRFKISIDSFTAKPWTASPSSRLTQDGHFGQECLIELPLADGAAHEDAAISVTVDCPQLDICLGLDGGSTRCPIDEGQLTKTASFSNAAIWLLVHVDLT